jgi:hypothetical protein
MRQEKFTNRLKICVHIAFSSHSGRTLGLFELAAPLSDCRRVRSTCANSASPLITLACLAVSSVAAKIGRTAQSVEKKQRVSPWWRTDLNGNYIMSIKFGSRPVEFEKGKAGIMVQTKEKVAGVIDTLIAAVRAGELDEHLNQAAKIRTIGKVKKAA